MSATTGDTSQFLTPSTPERREGEALLPAERQLLDEFNRRISGVSSLDEAMRLLWDMTGPLFDCDRLSLAFLDHDGERLVSRWVHTRYEPVKLGKGYVQDVRNSSLGRIIARGEPRVIEDLSGYLARHPASAATRMLLEEGIRSSMTCPLATAGRIVGVMFLCARRPSAFTAHHVRVHEAVAERLGQTVEKERRIEQVKAANRAYMEVLGFVSHELKNRFSTLLMACRMMREERYGPVTSEQRDRLDMVLDDGRSLMGLIREYLDLSRLEGAGLRLQLREQVKVSDEILIPAVRGTEDDFSRARMVLVQDLPVPGLVWRCDPDLLRVVVVNLLGNAAKYGREGATARLQTISDGGKLRVTVWNEGAGFRPSDEAALFRRFSRLPTPEHGRINGTGIGLYVSWRIVRLHGGRMFARSEYGRWAEFAFELPAEAPESPPSAQGAVE